MSRGASIDEVAGAISARPRSSEKSGVPVIEFPAQCGTDPRDEGGGNFGFIRPFAGTSHRLPQISIRKDKFYAVPVPADRKLREFLRGIVPHLAAGEVHRIEEWCELLQKAGIGHKKKGSDQVKAIGEATARLRWREVAYQTRLPLISMASDGAADDDPDGDARQGFGLARDRAEVRGASDSLRRRAAKMRAVADAGREAVEKGIDEETIRVPGLTADQQTALFDALKTRPHRNEQLAMVVVTGKQLHELEGQSLTPEQSALKESLSGSGVRQMIHDARLRGYKVCAGPTGYWRADSDSEMLDFCARLDDRAALVEKRADWTDEAGAFNFPETDAEKAEVARIVSSQFRVGEGGELSPDLRGPSPEYLASEEGARRARIKLGERDEEEMILVRGQATAYLDKKSLDPEYQRAQEKIDLLNSYKGTGISPGDDVPRPTAAERLLVNRVRSAKKVLQAKNPRQLPRAAKGEAPMPWERPAVGSKSKGRRNEPKTSSAAELLGQSNQRQSRVSRSAGTEQPIEIPF